MSNQLQITGGAKVRSLEGVITGTSGVLNSLPINTANGIPQLDSNGKILVSQLPNSVMEFKGVWSAATNTPTLANGTGNTGDVYLCNAAGTVNFGAGPITFAVGDYVVYDGTNWDRSSGAVGTVTSVAVTESSAALNITGSPITTSGTINIGFAGSSSQYVAGDGSLITFPSLTGYVPYTGATNDLNLGTHNLFTNNLFEGFTSVAASSTPIVLTIASNPIYLVTGSGGQTIKLPDATTLPNGSVYVFNNNQSSGAITVNNNSNTLVVSIPSGGYCNLELIDNSIAAGSWDRHFQAPSNVSWSTNTFDYPGSITSATWNGNIIAINRGGTGASTAATALANLGGVPTSRTLTINGVGYDLSADRSWTINSMVYPSAGIAVSTGTAWGTSITDNSSNWNTAYSLRISSATSPLSISSNVISISQASGSTDGYLSSTDWTTFNNKQNALTNPITGTGASQQVAYWNGTNTQTGSNNLKFDGSNLSIGNYGSALAQLHVYNGSAAASFLLQTNSTTNYSEIAVRNDSSTATSYFRQYSTATTGTDFGVARAGLATFFSNYATNFVIGTLNGGNLIFGTANTERARILSSNGYFGLNTTSPAFLLDINGTARISGQLTLGSTITNGTSTYTLPSSTGTLALTSQLSTGTVTSVDLSVPTGFSVSGNPITTSGTLALSFATGYALPTTASQTNWDSAYTNRITNLTTTGSSGSATLVSNTLNIPTYTLAGLGGVSSNIYTADGTLASNRTISAGGFTLTINPQTTYSPSVTAASAIARGTIFTPTLTAAANNDVLSGLYINPTFTNGAFTGVTNAGLIVASGLVGIGITNPSYLLHVSGNTTGNNYGYIANTNASGTSAWVAVNDQSDNIVTRTFGSTNGGTQFGVSVNRSASIVANLGTGGSYLLGTFSSSPLIIGTNNTEALRVNTSQQIGIGTSTIGSKLQVNGNAAIGYSASTAAPTNGLAVAGNTTMSGTLVIDVASAPTFTVRNPTASSYASYRLYNDQNSSVRALEVDYAGSTYASALVTNGFVGEGAAITTTGAYPISFATNNTYRMGINSSGSVGIGTITIGSTLQVNGNAAIGYSASTAAPTNGLLVSGNVGINVTPQAYGSAYRVIQIGQRGALYCHNSAGSTYLSENIWDDGASSKYIVTGPAAGYQMSNGIHYWYQGISGTGGTTVTLTTAMQLNASNNLGIGTTTIGSKLQVNGNAAIGYSASTAAPTNGLSVAGTVNIGTNTSVTTAALQVSSTTQGFLPPVMTTTQKNAIASPATGLIVFDSTLAKLCVYASGAWQTITSV